jgi:hypothetical protein
LETDAITVDLIGLLEWLEVGILYAIAERAATGSFLQPRKKLFLTVHDVGVELLKSRHLRFLLPIMLISARPESPCQSA